MRKSLLAIFVCASVLSFAPSAHADLLKDLSTGTNSLLSSLTLAPAPTAPAPAATKPTPEPDAPATPPPTNPTVAPIAKRQLRGFDVGLPFMQHEEQSTMTDLKLADEMGSEIVRFSLNWGGLETSNNTYNQAFLKQLDNYFAEAKRRDIKILATTLLTPCWASNMSCTNNYNYAINAPADPAQFADFIKFAANRWGDRIHAFEVWNEPNNKGFWQGTPKQYVSLVKAADQGVAASNYKNILVVSASLAGSDGAYLQSLYDAGISLYSDVISVHPYEVSWGGSDYGFRDPSVERPGGEFGSFSSGPPYLKNIMRQNGDQDPIWITEFGYATCPATPFCVTEANHAKYMKSALEIADKWDFVDAFIMFRLRDIPGNSSSFEYHFGVYNANFTPKPAVSSVKQALQTLQ